MPAGRVLTLAPAPRKDAGGVNPEHAGLLDVCAAIAEGAGLPAAARAAGRALQASIAVLDPAGAVLAVAARSAAEERALLASEPGVEDASLSVGGLEVGCLRLRPREPARFAPTPAVLAAVRTLLASEIERVRGPERATVQAEEAFLRAVLAHELVDGAEIVVRGRELGAALEAGGSVLVVRAHPHAPRPEDWRARLLEIARRTARGAAPGALGALDEARDVRAGQAVVLVPGADETLARRAAEAVARELPAHLPGFVFTVGRSRVAREPGELARAGHEARLAANVAQTDPPGAERSGAPATVLAFDETGAYRLLLSAMSEDPGELERFYAETLEPLVAYDEQYEIDLVRTLETFLDCDANVAAAAQRLFAHRHTIRYRLERIRDLTGLDVGSSDGREKLSLGLKAMRVLGIPPGRGPATEAGTEAGRVPRAAKDR